jgi:16S rRNA processing protein RimM
LLRPRGRRGEFLAEIYSSHPGRAEKLDNVVLELGERRLLARLDQVWYHGGRPVLKFSGIDSIGDAEPWSGADILVPEPERAAPDEGEFSHADLIGCRILAASEIGTVTGVEDYGGAPLLRVATGGGREILIPFARAICREIDVAAKTIRIDPPEGLLDL